MIIVLILILMPKLVVLEAKMMFFKIMNTLLIKTVKINVLNLDQTVQDLDFSLTETKQDFVILDPLK